MNNNQPNTINNTFFSNTILIVLFFILLYAFLYESKWRRNSVIESDVIVYYLYLPATFIYKDLTLKYKENFPDIAQYAWHETTIDGKYVIKVSMGLSLLYMPFFLMAHGLALVFNLEPTGYSKIYSLFLTMSSFIYLFIGLIFLKKLLVKCFSDIVAAITIFTIVIGTNLWNYVTWEPGMAHTYNFSLIILFIYYTILWHENPTKRKSVFLGLLFGLIILIRPVNILIGLLFIFYSIRNTKDLKSQFVFFIQNWINILIIGVCVIFVWIPQIIYWKLITGNFLYYSYGNESFHFNDPHIIEGLIGYRKGLITYTPVLVLGVIGLFTVFKNFTKGSWAFVIFFLLYFYVIQSWWSWWYGGSFGHRAVIDIFGVLALGMASLLTIIFNKKFSKIIVSIFIILCLFLNQFQIWQYKNSLIHWDSMSKKAYWFNFGKNYYQKEFEDYLIPPDYSKK